MDNGVVEKRQPDAAEAEGRADQNGGPSEVVKAEEPDATAAAADKDGATVVQSSEEDGNEELSVRSESNGKEDNGVVTGADLNEVGTDQSAGGDRQGPQNGIVARRNLENGQPVVVESSDKDDLVAEVEEKEQAGLDGSKGSENGDALVAGEACHLIAVEDESTEDDSHAKIVVEKDTADDADKDHLDTSRAKVVVEEDTVDDENKELLDVSRAELIVEEDTADDANQELSDASHAEVVVEEDVADDAGTEHLEEEAMAGVIREYVTEAVLADHSKEPMEKSMEETASSERETEVHTQSGSEPAVVVEELHDSSSSDDENKGASILPTQSANSGPGSSNGPSLPSHPAGLGSATSLLETPTRHVQQARSNGPAAVERETRWAVESAGDNADENDEIREKLQMIRVKFLRLAHRFGQTPHNVVVSQVLYRLGLAEQLRRNTAHGVFSYDRAREMAERLEAAGNEPLDLSCTILVLGKTGVGKSATINSIFDDVRLQTNAFEFSTRKVQEIVGMVQGIKVKVIDTPGLSCSSSDQHNNQKVLQSVKRLISKNPPDIVLYFDRLDMQSRDYGDVPLLQTIINVFGPSIWFNAIVVLTHAASAPPDGPNGIPLSYEMFVTQRSHVVQQAIRQAAGDVRLMNPVSLVENHSACRMNRSGQRVLPNGQVWKPQLLLLCFASKVLAEANVLLKLQDSPTGKPSRARVPPLPFLLSSLLQSRPPLKLPEEQFGDDDDALEDDLVDGSDSDEGSDYDDLPPFKRLTKTQLARLNQAQRKAYLEELDYREKLFYKKQLKEERMHRKMMKKMAAEASARPDDLIDRNLGDESNAPTSVSVPMPDMVLPSSFDSDYPSHRYRFLDTPSEWLVRPVLEAQGWDHDVGYEGLNVERLFVVKGKVPLSVSGQLTKDKKECALQMEVASSVKHGYGKTTTLGLDLQSVGKDIAYTIRGESRFKNFKHNNTVTGLSVTLLGDSVSAGLKVEDKLIVNKQLRVLVSGGAMTGRGDVAYGGRLEATLRDKNYPIGHMLSTVALSVVDWQGNLAVGCNVQSQIPAGRGTNLIGHANLSNKGTGQIGIRLNSSEQLQIALIALVPILQNIRKMLHNYSQST